MEGHGEAKDVIQEVGMKDGRGGRKRDSWEDRRKGYGWDKGRRMEGLAVIRTGKMVEEGKMLG